MFYVGTLSPDTSTSIPTVTDNLFSSGTIDENQLSISFEPITDSSGTQINGELTWGVYPLRPWIRILKFSSGGTDSDKFTGSITFA